MTCLWDHPKNSWIFLSFLWPQYPFWYPTQKHLLSRCQDFLCSLFWEAWRALSLESVGQWWTAHVHTRVSLLGKAESQIPYRTSSPELPTAHSWKLGDRTKSHPRCGVGQFRRVCLFSHLVLRILFRYYFYFFIKIFLEIKMSVSLQS